MRELLDWVVWWLWWRWASEPLGWRVIYVLAAVSACWIVLYLGSLWFGQR